MMPPTTILSIENINKTFGGIRALTNVSLDVATGSIHGLIGPNGAGKTTLFNIITGYLKADAGEVRYGGRNILGLPPNAIAQRGLIRTFQQMKQLGALSVYNNVKSGCYRTTGASLWERATNGRACAKRDADARERVWHLLQCSGLAEKAKIPSALLTFGELRFLDVARALAADPQVLLLDEPGAGLNRDEVCRLEILLKEMKGNHLTIVLIEHDVEMVFGLCSRVSVLDYGGLIAEGTPDEIRGNPKVMDAYLGVAVEPSDLKGGCGD